LERDFSQFNLEMGPLLNPKGKKEGGGSKLVFKFLKGEERFFGLGGKFLRWVF